MTGLDYSELDGYQSPRQQAISRWRDRNDDREFERLCTRLRVARWQEQHPERTREIKRESWRRNVTAERRQRASAAAHIRRQKAYRDNPILCTCVECGTCWIPYHRGGVRPNLVSRFCSNRCYQRFRARKRGRRGERVYTCSVCGGLGHSRRSCREATP